MEPDTRTPGDQPLDPATVRRIKWGLVALGALALAVLAFFIARELKSESTQARWDELAQIRERFEPELGQDPLYEDPGGVYGQRRERYIQALEAFLPRAAEEEDALAAHTHYLIAKLSTDQFYATKDAAHAEARARHFERATKHWETLRDTYPDFQTNWLSFAPPKHASVTRMALSTLEANNKWIEDHFPGEKEPATDVVAVIRTERGDMHMGLYREDAPDLTALFLERATQGAYDGTYFFAKTEIGQDDDPSRRTIRGGHPDVREVLPFDPAAAARFAEDEQATGMMPQPSRYRIAASKGVVLGWHDATDPYDGPQQLLVSVDRSPQLDHRFSPFGKLLDEPSRATATRIYEGKTWGDATTGQPPKDLATIRDVMRAPVKIVKVLVYRDGAMVEPTGKALETKADVGENEQKLADLVRDVYRTEAPEAPKAPEAPEKPETPEDAPSDPE